MKRGGPLQRRTPLARTEMKRKRTKSKGEFHPTVRAEIERRSGGRCEANCSSPASHIHHIRRRSQGGEGTTENGLHVCSDCHTWIHANPAKAEALGWLKRSGHDT